MKKHIIVIGGGMAGTAAAYHLQKKGYTVTILERNDRLGGRIHSIATKDAIFEVGAGFITDIYINIFAFIRENNLSSYLQKRRSKAAIVKNGSLHWIRSTTTIIGNSLISFRAKSELVKQLLKVFLKKGNFDVHNFAKIYKLDTKSIAEAFSTKSGKELIAYLIQPALDGYCYWSADKISYAVLFLFFKLVLVRQKTYILKCGLQRIPETAAKNAQVLLSHRVSRVKKVSDDAYEVMVRHTNKMKKLRANGIVCATTATEVLRILELTKTQKEFFSQVSYSATVLVSKTYSPKIPPANYAIAYPRKENKTIGAVTIVSDTGNDKNKPVTLVKLYAAGKSGEELCWEKDEYIDKKLTQEASLITSLFSASEKPSFSYMQRWFEAIPEFVVGSFKRLHSFENGEIESENDNIVFAGDYLGGPFIEGAFTSGLQAAERLDSKMKF